MQVGVLDLQKEREFHWTLMFESVAPVTGLNGPTPGKMFFLMKK